VYCPATSGVPATATRTGFAKPAGLRNGCWRLRAADDDGPLGVPSHPGAISSTGKIYAEYFLYEESKLDYGSFASPLDYITDEWLWHWLIGYLVNDLAVPVSLIFGVISFLCLFTFAYFLASRGSIWAVPLLVNPLIVPSHFRNCESPLLSHSCSPPT
jgi:hypothetical protein